jgi:hypothetical protein
LPHGDTFTATYKRLKVPEVQEVVTTTVKTLIRKKVLDRYRLLTRCFLISIDGTGMLTFPERHCPHYLTVTHHGRTTYCHPVLEAKLVTHDGFVFSFMTEFIENPSQYHSKQDCELKAFYRLAGRLKQTFPRLPICLLLDGLFAGGPTPPSPSASGMAGSTSSSSEKRTCPQSRKSSTPSSLRSPKTTSAFIRPTSIGRCKSSPG